jgi:nucleotide-binding universal stress UspA family protein
VAHLLDLLEKRGCDLIVMGTHGHSWLRQRLFGSVTEEVIRRARCPVMVVKAPAHAEAPPAPKLAKAGGK